MHAEDDDQHGELFGKIDALLEKRAAGALVDTPLADDDFPVLTDVIVPPPPAFPWGEAERRTLDRRQIDRRGEENRRQGDRRSPPSSPSEAPQSPPVDPLAAFSPEQASAIAQMIESRLSDLFMRHQSRLEGALRQAIREELGRSFDN